MNKTKQQREMNGVYNVKKSFWEYVGKKENGTTLRIKIAIETKFSTLKLHKNMR
jgi:hypothetical protein